MNKTIINKDQVTSIEVYQRCESERYKYKEREVIPQTFWDILFFRPQKFNEGGFYEIDAYCGTFFKNDILLSEDDFITLNGSVKYSVEYKTVFINDHIIIKTSDGSKQFIYFKSKAELDTFMNTHFNERKYLDITNINR